MSVYTYDDNNSVHNSYSDEYSAVSSSHSPTNSPSSYKLDNHPKHDWINPSQRLNFYGKMSVAFNSPLPALIKFHPGTGQTNTQVEKWENDSSPNYDSIKSLDDENMMDNPNTPLDAINNNDGATNVSMVNYVDETNFIKILQPVVNKNSLRRGDKKNEPSCSIYSFSSLQGNICHQQTWYSPMATSKCNSNSIPSTSNQPHPPPHLPRPSAFVTVFLHPGWHKIKIKKFPDEHFARILEQGRLIIMGGGQRQDVNMIFLPAFTII